jgi:hypothetical protein
LTEEHYPFAIERSTFRPSPDERPDTKVHALELDPTLLSAVSGPGAAPLISVQPAGEGERHLVWTKAGRFELVDGPVGQTDLLLASGTSDANLQAMAAVGLRGRFLVYVEVGTGKRPDADGRLLTELLQRAGCSRILLLSGPLAWVLGEGRDLSGHPVEPVPRRLYFGKTLTSRAHRIFSETPVVQRSVWRPLQRRRTE